MLRRDQPRVNHNAPGANYVVMIALPILHAAHLHDPKAATVRTEIGRDLLQVQHAMSKTLELSILSLHRKVVQQ
jgi:hypothetical protein